MGVQIHEFDFDQVDCIFGLAPIDGWAEDSVISIEEDEEAFKIKKGVKGDITRSKVHGQTALVTLTLMSSSKSNAYLSGIHKLDKSKAGGAGITPILIRDRNGVSLFASDKAWIEKAPTVTYGAEASAREWKIRVVDYELFEGGT